MPRLIALKDHQVEVLSERRFLSEAELHALLEAHPELIALDEVDATSLPLLTIGPPATGNRQLSSCGQRRLQRTP